MPDPERNPLDYESPRELSRRKRFLRLTPRAREVVVFVLWMLGLLAAGIVLGLIVQAIAEMRRT